MISEVKGKDTVIMIITKPDFYDSFKCKADKCTDSCCIGWEIDIDDETMRKYEAESGFLSEKLNSFTDRGNHCFILTKDERCPFLKSDGLCELILTKGEDMLCEICREHPRFYARYGNFYDMGVGLCCEEAARLLFLNTSPLKLITAAESRDDAADFDDGLIDSETLYMLREETLHMLCDRTQALHNRIHSIFEYLLLKQYGKINFAFPSEGEFYDILIKASEKTEAYDADFTRLLKCLRENKSENLKRKKTFISYLGERKTDYEKLLSYLMFRHFPKAVYDGDALGKFCFCVGVTAITFYADVSLFAARGKFDLDDRINSVKYLSKQFEYSDENPEISARELTKQIFPK